MQTQQTENAKPAMATTLSDMRVPATAAQANIVRMGFGDSSSFELIQRAAKLLASSSLVPKEYQGNIPNCVIALNMSQRIGADPLMVMQNLVIVHNRPTWSSQFLIATVNTCGRFTALRFEFFGQKGTDSWGCRAWAIEKATGEKLVGADITIAIAKKEGWYNKTGSKWQSIPQQMLMYRAGSWWTRAYAPELAMGLHTAEEMHDVYDAERGPDGSFSVSTDELRGAHIDRETGEVLELQPPAGATTPADRLREQLAAATNGDALDLIADEISLLESEADRKALTELYLKRRAELAG